MSGRPAPLWLHLLRAAPVIIVISLTTLALERLGWLDGFATAGIDSILLVRQPRDMKDVIVVALTKEEYEAEYAGVRVLTHQDLERLIDAIAAGGAAVIGIDLDTTARAFAATHRHAAWPPIVWGAAAEFTIGGSYLLSPPVGGAKLDAKEIGLAVLTADPDGVVRHAQRDVRDTNGQLLQTFPWAVVSAYCRTPGSDCAKVRNSGDPLDERLIDYTGARSYPSPIPFHAALAFANLAQAGPGHARPVEGKVVLVGAVLGSNSDMHRTPMGEKPGVFVMAEQIDSELNGGGITDISWFVSFLLDIAVGVVIVFLHFFLRVRAALALSLAAIPILSLCSSYLAFSSFARWFNFVPMVVGVLIHELYERGKAYRELQKAYEQLSANR